MRPLRGKFGKLCRLFLSVDQKDQRRRTVYGWGQAVFFQNLSKETKIYYTCQLCVYLRKLMHTMPTRESARKPRENIDAFNMDSRSGLSSIKSMEENRRLCTNI